MVFDVSCLPQCAVMGIVNVTPDSFSDGGRYLASKDAISHAHSLIEKGASIIDIGGESTRPGAVSISVDEELDRIMPVVVGVRESSSALLSVDTTKPSVAREALLVGVDIINDVSGGSNPEMLEVVAEFDAGIVLMHMQGQPLSMQVAPQYANVVDEVADYLVRQKYLATVSGIRAEAIIVDPGIGFGKTVEHNLALLGSVVELRDRVGAAVMIGASRKRTLAAIVGDDEHARDDATMAVSVMSFVQGAAIVRVHDVSSSVLAAKWITTRQAAA